MIFVVQLISKLSDPNKTHINIGKSIVRRCYF